MAKKYNAGEVVLRFSDDGSVKILNKNVKEAGKSQASFAKNVNESDRRLKSLSQQTSNSTKGFSKQAQTISGGLVPVYATLAAQVFAVSAAFRFLQDSFETRNLIEGQKNFGMITGTAYQHITANVQKASQSMLNFRDAAQAVAIGTAAGLTASQMERLGAAASNVSLALGRDVTDSFNRLVRGATKAEPELLDELGIVLRLDPALKNYANQLGKSKEDLNQFEKSQAIVNDVLDQAERKFGAIQKYMDPSAFALQQFGKEFDDLMNTFKVGLANFLTPAIGFLKDNVGALVGVLTMAFLPVLKSILPAFDEMALKAEAATTAATTAVTNAKANLYGVQGGDKAAAFFGKSAKENRDQAGTSIKGMFEAKGQKSPSMMHNQMNQQMINSTRRRLKKEGDLRKVFNKQERAQLKVHLNQMEAALRMSEMKKQAMHQQTANRFKVLQAQAVVVYRTAQAKMVQITQMGARAMNTAMKAAGFIGIALMLFDLGKGIVDFFFGASESVKKAKEDADEYVKSMKSLNAELDRMAGLRGEGVLSQTELVEQMGNAFGSADLTAKRKNFNDILASDATQEQKDAGAREFLTALDKLENLSGPRKEIINLRKAIGDGNKEEIATAMKAFTALEQRIIRVGQASKLQGEKMKVLRQQISSTVGGIAKLRGQGLAEAYADLMESRTSSTSGIATEMQKNIDAIDVKGAGQKTFDDFKLSGYAQSYLQQMEEFGETSYRDKRLDDIKAELAARDEAVRLAEEEQQKVKDRLQGEKDVFDAVTKKLEAEKVFVEQIQKDGIALDKAKLAVLKEQAEIGFGSSLAQQQAKNEIKNKNAINKQSEAQLKLDGAILAQKLLVRDTENETTEQFQIRVEAAQHAVDMAQEEKNISDQIVKNTSDEVGYLNTKLAFEFQILRLKNEQLAIQNRIAARERGQKYDINAFGFGKKASERSNLISNLSDKKTMSADMQSALEGRLAELDPVLNEQEYLSTQAKINAEKQKQLDLQMQINYEQTRATTFAQNQLKTELEIMNQKVFTLNPIETKFQEMRLAHLKEFGNLTDFNAEAVRKLAAEHVVLGTIQKEMGGLQDQMSNGFTQMFENFVSGTMSAKEAFKQFAADTLMYIAKMYARMAAFALLTSMGVPMPAMPGMGTGARSGGVMSAPGYRSYASGGVASGPDSGYLATLHGTEAVVPLGNDRSIPVELKGGAGSNVIVNITMAGGQSQTTTQGGGDGAGMEQLGRIIGGLVQKELADQQRPGGLLSPYNTNI